MKLATPILLAFVIAASAQAAFADSKTEAKQHFELATAAHKDGRFSDALRELMTAYALDPRPELLYAIGQMHVKLGQCAQAVTFYERFIASDPKPDHAARARKAIEVCKTNPPPPEAQQPIDPAKPREELGLAASENLRKAKEAEALIAVEQRKTEEARIAAEREREREKLYDRHPARKWAYVAGVVGIGSLVTGGVFGMSSRNAHASFTDGGCGMRDQPLTADQVEMCRNDAERGESAARLSNVFLVAGGAVLATSVLIFVIDPGNVERPDHAAARVTVTPSSIQFTARW